MTRYRVTVDGRTYDVDVDDPRARPVVASVSGTPYSVDVDVDPAPAETSAGDDSGDDAGQSAGEDHASEDGSASANREPRTMNAPIPGVVAKVTARRGRMVAHGDELLTIEAMKMFNVMRSPWTGRVQAVHVKDGDQVVQGQPLVTVTPR